MPAYICESGAEMREFIIAAALGTGAYLLVYPDQFATFMVWVQEFIR
jgi:hypothetical protein